MASITDYVVEGLKYPFKDIRKLLCFGVLFVALNLISLARGMKSVDVFRNVAMTIESTNTTASLLSYSQLPMNDIYLLAALSVVTLIITFFILGYQYNVIKFSIGRNDELPGFGDVAGIFVKGIKYFISTLAYYLIPAVVLVAGVALSADYSYGLYVIIISFILFIIAYFLQIMAVNNMVAHDSLSKAFDFEEITGKISSLGWGKYIGTVIFTLIVFMIVMAAAGFIIAIITGAFALAVNSAVVVSAFAAVLEGLFVTSYGSIFFERVCGSIYYEADK